MGFQEYSEQRRLLVNEQEYKETRVNELAYRYIDGIFSCDALGYTKFRNFRLERGDGFVMRLTAHQVTVTGIFEHVRIDEEFGGRWTFWRRQRDETGQLSGVAIFSIEFDHESRLRYGSEDGWHERIERNPTEPWKSRDRLIANLVAAIQDKLEEVSAR
jgi:hypothetical protein